MPVHFAHFLEGEHQENRVLIMPVDNEEGNDTTNNCIYLDVVPNEDPVLTPTTKLFAENGLILELMVLVLKVLLPFEGFDC